MGARPAIKAAAALPALFSSMKLMVELMISNTTIPTKSCQSGGLPPPLAKTMAIMAAASMTHDKGFHMKPKNLRNLLSFFSSSLFGLKILSLSSPWAVLNPSLVHFSCWNTSSTGILSYIKMNTAVMINIFSMILETLTCQIQMRSNRMENKSCHVVCVWVEEKCLQDQYSHFLSALRKRQPWG